MFYHRDLNLALAFPEGWQIENSPDAIVGRTPQKDALVMVKILALPSDSSSSLESFLKGQVKLSAQFQGKPIADVKLPSVTGTDRLASPFGKRETRVSAIHYDQNAYLFFGAAKEPAAFARFDPDFIAVAASLRPLKLAEKPWAEGQRLRLVRARAGDTFAGLAKASPLTEYSEPTLRLINGQYPEGEPRAGEFIKIIEWATP
jgi:predicted Zn-dependent protease